MVTKRALLIVILLLSVTGIPCAQTTLNPDVSLIGDVRIFSHDDATRQDEKEKFNIAEPKMELMVSGYINPYARADAVVAWEGDENANVEEIYATILRGLPLGMNVRVGRYKLEFGRLNPVHVHAYSFMERPLPHLLLFGEEGLSDMAVRVSFLLPTGGAYTEVMGAVLKGDVLTKEVEDLPEHIDPGFFGRVATSFAVSDAAELALGTSVLNSVYAVAGPGNSEQLRAWLGGVDAKYKYKPSRYTTLQIEAEGIIRTEEKEYVDNYTSYGGYGYIDYRFKRSYNIGGILSYTHMKELMSLPGSTLQYPSDIWRAGLFTGFAPIEETSLVRLGGSWTKQDRRNGYWGVMVQFVFSLGPHQPHNF